MRPKWRPYKHELYADDDDDVVDVVGEQCSCMLQENGQHSLGCCITFT